MNVKKRVVYYLSGFDPRGVHHYYSLYKENFNNQMTINGMKGTVSPRKNLHQWEIDATDQGIHVNTLYNFLSWDDIIRSEWSSGLLNYYKDLFYCIVAYLSNGLIIKYAKASPKQMIAGLYPGFYLLGALVIAIYGSISLYQSIEGIIGIASGIIFSILTMMLFEKIGNTIGVFWLLRIYAFSVRWGRGEIDTIEERINHFSDAIAIQLNIAEDVDEVLLISHSVGTILAVSVLARILEKADHLDKFGMITLGECIPLVSFQPNADKYRAELQKIAENKDIIWVDYTAPIDGACFPLHDFMQSSSIQQSGMNLHYLSPRFHTLFDKITYAKLRRDWYTTHFLYLMSTEISGGYDYYKISAGAMSIRDKIDHLKS
ncbi:MAG: hypothetical protein PHW18_02335 [Sulfuricurvum sp.]|uniref:hypothetical protein n=1 Tax=Sulfuricurvum sp. TaxID=2025608 RepID=UPI002638666A|nr:hypothetical protein [Sulfuricurvum sp.]MDD2828393.1 hypothetical protein [Sulfuricurvum sp.]MDD4949398.1 hypothetical protein [Sulfuricurvum sp.]